MHGASWSEVQALLREAVSDCVVKAENSASSDRLDYRAHPKGLTVIGVGGFALGRGLTLEGLSVSYILRNTKMYDTLLRMARWFGVPARLRGSLPGLDDAGVAGVVRLHRRGERGAQGRAPEDGA